jgi:ribosomal protein S24E
LNQKTESKVLDRWYVEVPLEGKAGKLTRNEAIKAASEELGVPQENIGLISLDGGSGTTDLVGRFFAYGSQETLKRLHPRYLQHRTLSKEEREKLKQERKKAAVPAAEAKK